MPSIYETVNPPHRARPHRYRDNYLGPGQGENGGGGDLSSNTALSVDSELVVFSGTTGKLVKRGTGSGLAWIINGVLGTKTPVPTGALVGTTDAQTLTSKTITGASNTLSIREADLVLTDVTTRDVSISQHGFVPKAPGGTTAFLRGDATWAAHREAVGALRRTRSILRVRSTAH